MENMINIKLSLLRIDHYFIDISINIKNISYTITA